MENKILVDHVCISKKLRRTLQDVLVKRGANIACFRPLPLSGSSETEAEEGQPPGNGMTPPFSRRMPQSFKYLRSHSQTGFGLYKRRTA